MNTNLKSIALAITLFFMLSASISAAPGDLDLTFGNGGVVITRVSSFARETNFARAMVIQADGKIIVVGDGATGDTWDFVVVRYNSDGTHDFSFGGNGIVVTPVGSSHDVANSIAIQADGKIVVAGSCGDGMGGSRFAIVRYNPNGTLDTSFNGTGIVFGSPNSSASGLAIQSDGKIVVAGSAFGFAIVRYNIDGSLDNTFNGTGKVVTPVGDGPFFGSARSVAIQSDGKIVAAGVSQNDFSAFTVVRYNPDGTLDTAFNGTGKVVTPLGGSHSNASELAIQSDGKIVVAGDAPCISGNVLTRGFALVRYNQDGSLDTSFNGTGNVITSVGNSYSKASSVAIQSNGKIVAAGYRTNNIGFDFAVVRFNPNGSLDTSFNGTGEVITWFGGQDSATAAAIQVDGKIVVVGGTDNFFWDNYDFTVVRYQGDTITTPGPTPSPTPIPIPTPTPLATPPIPPPVSTLRANGKIAFTSDRDGNREIYIMNDDGTNHVRLTNNSLVDDHPTWSPDGTMIAFVSEKSSGGFAIFHMSADGTNKTEITPISFDPSGSISGTWSMSWSPAGNQIVFQDKPHWSDTANDIFIVNINGTNRHVLVNEAVDERQPAWSPDGSRIVFCRQRLSISRYDLFTIKPDGTDLRALANQWGYSRAPSWSPTGDKITFTVFDIANYIFLSIANPDGSDLQEFVADADKPKWSPDGSKMLFQKEETFGTEIYVKDIDGTVPTRLTDTPENNFNPSWQPVVPGACPNPIDCAALFVTQHYRDFLNREPDTAGLAFWTNEITSCGGEPQCVEVKRINVSAAFFLSIEFQETGYLVYRMYKAAYGELSDAPMPLTRQEFLTDTQQIGHGVVVGSSNWEQAMENNKNTYITDFVTRTRFGSAFPAGMTAEQFVDALNANAGGVLSNVERDLLVGELVSGTKTRAQILRSVAQDPDLARNEFNKAFVLMQYFGYLRRNPNDFPDLNFGGYDFWLNKLNQFNGDFVAAEMVKAFISSAEYRQRFSQP